MVALATSRSSGKWFAPKMVLQLLASQTEKNCFPIELLKIVVRMELHGTVQYVLFSELEMGFVFNRES